MDSLDKDGTIQNRLVRVYGRVQGVGYREACVRRARAQGATRPTADGRGEPKIRSGVSFQTGF